MATRNARQPHARARIAELAARLVAEHGIADYALAKRKAARQLGLPPGHGLPSNEEVDAALIERRNLFDPLEQARQLAALRAQARAVMRVFARFEPALTGGVASGAVGEHSHIELDVQADSSKDFEQFLINEGIEYRVRDRGAQMAYLIFSEPADVLVRMQAREGRHAHAGHHGQRLTLAQLDRLMESGA